MLKTIGDAAVNLNEILDFCGSHNIVRDVALIPIEKVSEAVSAICKAPSESVSPSTEHLSRSIRTTFLDAIGAWN